MGTLIAIAIAAVVLVLGFALMGAVFKLIGWLIVGLIVGALARLLLPGDQNLSLLRTTAYGIAGALVGGLLAGRVFHVGGLLEFGLSVLSAAGLVTVLNRKRLP